MNSPAGTFMAKVRGGALEFPPPIRSFCEVNGWTLFRVLMLDDDRLEIQPVLPDDNSDFNSEYHSSLSAEGRLWIPAALREMVSLGEQSIMMRVEEGVIRIYLRKVFKTLGFGP
jgi:hypothetical protein